ncbi:hypothetical protein KIN20_012501 [Parelaphostrongylus tenuis]|uniref:SCP domain-containing protein n=1 Tax=Parelaphostrongylus tenuis TaxID=148309 RepID=A0AAD5MTF3_PARTN|nr:hypothetical protein KIN20_012501 [Parelaphostrongylus tenuis]
MHSFVALLILVTVSHAASVDRFSVPICEQRTMMKHRDRENAVLAHNIERKELARGFFGSYPTASNMSYLTYNCDLENEAYRLAKHYCKNESQSIPGYEGINRAIIHNRAIGNRVAAINFQYEVQQWTKTAHPYNDSNGLKPSYHEESELPFFVVCSYEFISNFAENLYRTSRLC